MEEIVRFWNEIWSKSKTINLDTDWLAKENQDSTNYSEMSNNDISTEEVSKAIQECSNWKAPGPDKIHNIWLKKFTATHSVLAVLFTKMLRDPHETPLFFLMGNTFLIPKGNNTLDPANYRPITCLSTTYKLMTKILTNRVYHHCVKNNIITQEQKGCAKNSMGCKEQLTIDSVLVHQAVQGKRNLSMGYIDYKKAFDSLPHNLLLKILETYKIDTRIVNFMKVTMESWKVKLHLGSSSSQDVSIKCGIFQGDAFSPLWFCLCMNPLSKMLKNLNLGFKLKAETGTFTVNHLLYVDDLKLYTSNKEKMHRMIHLVKQFSDDIGMEFGIEKCKTIHIQKGKVQSENEGFHLDEHNIIANLSQEENYKYLGFLQLKGIQESELKKMLRENFHQRLTKVLKSHLNAGNKRKAINTWAIPVLTYSFGIVNWSNTNLDELSTLLRTTLTKYLCHHPRSALERITLPFEDSGRGFLDIPNLHFSQINKLRDYFRSQVETSDLIRTVCLADKNYTPLNLKTSEIETPPNVLTREERIDVWKSKSLHGIHPFQLSQDFIDIPSSNLWLQRGSLFAETEGFIIAIQDKVIATKNYRKFILRENLQNDSCRRCQNNAETIDHIIGGCTSLASHDYTARHNQVAKIIHQNLAVQYNLAKEKLPYYKYEPPPVLENSRSKLYWDRSMITDRTIRANKPDIVLFDKVGKKIILFDVAVPLNHNLQSTYNTKIEKYTDLANELKTMYHMERVDISPIIISATGLIPKKLIVQLKKHKLENALEIMQKAVILNTCNIVRRFLQPTDCNGLEHGLCPTEPNPLA